jgi:predicted ribonuclease YlaK
MKYAAPDTNYFLHYQSPEYVDWRTILGASEVQLVIFPTVIKELDRKKDDASPIIRKRAQAAISRLRGFRKSGSSIREGVTIAFESREPLIDFEANQLDSKHPDDPFEASGIQLRSEKRDLDLTIVTHDFGLELKASSRFPVIGLRDEYRLPEEMDPKDDEIKKLRTEVDRLHSRFPGFSIEFPGRRTENGLGACSLFRANRYRA